MNIAFSGKMRSGKTTAAFFLVEEFGMWKLSFAGKLKDTCVDLFGKERGLSREVLQGFGSYCRSLESDVWINYVVRTVEAKPSREFVVDDLRYKNEAAALEKLGFYIIRIERPEVERLALAKELPGYHDGAENHISETDLDDYKFHYSFYNTGSFGVYEHNVKQMYSSLKEINEGKSKEVKP